MTMQSDKYKVASQHPCAFSRGALEETERVLKLTVPALVLLIEQALSQSAIEKPSRHTGGQNTDFISVQISLPDAEIIRDAFVDMEAASVGRDGSTTALASQYAGMADAWTNYMLWLEDNAG